MLTLFGTRGLTGPNLTDNGLLSLGGGKLGENVLTIGSTGTLRGAGTVAATVTDNGIIEAHNGTLTLQKATTGTGALKIDGGATLEVGVSSVNTEKLAFTGSGGFLQIDAATGFGTPISGLLGNSIVLPNSVITGDSVSRHPAHPHPERRQQRQLRRRQRDFRVQAGDFPATATRSPAFGNAVASSHAPEPVALGAVRVGGTLTTALSIGNAAPTSGPYENLDASIGAASSGVTASGSFTGLAAGATDSHRSHRGAEHRHRRQHHRHGHHHPVFRRHRPRCRREEQHRHAGGERHRQRLWHRRGAHSAPPR